MLRCPRWNGDYKQWLALDLLWWWFHDHWSRRCGADLMAKILITTLPEAKRALYTELHMMMGWTYQQVWLDLAGRGRAYKAGVHCGGYGQPHSLRLESRWRNMKHGC